MTHTNGFDRPTVSGGLFPSVALPPEALDGVRTRRMMAVGVDFAMVSLIVAAIWIVVGVLTLGLGFFLLAAIPPLFPIVAFFYNGFGSSGAKMGTLGMRMFDQRRDPRRAVLCELAVPAGPALLARRARQALPARHLLRRDPHPPLRQSRRNDARPAQPGGFSFSALRDAGRRIILPR